MTALNSHIESLLLQRESVSLEYKTCASQLNRDVYETICAFLNRHGGTILLGVKDSGEVSGVDPDAVAQLGLSHDQVETLRYCRIERSRAELLTLLERTSLDKLRVQVLKPLLEAGLLEMTIPDKPTSSKQKYRSTEAGTSVIEKAPGEK
jgi:hypothetical protein